KGNQQGALLHFQQALKIDPNMRGAQQWVAKLSAPKLAPRPVVAAPPQSAPPVPLASRVHVAAGANDSAVTPLPPVARANSPVVLTSAPVRSPRIAKEANEIAPSPAPAPEFLEEDAPARDVKPKTKRTFKLQSPDIDRE